MNALTNWSIMVCVCRGDCCSQNEKHLLRYTKQTLARKELVLLHEDISIEPTNTLKWLEQRKDYYQACHHVRFSRSHGEKWHREMFATPGGVRRYYNDVRIVSLACSLFVCEL
jgi:hypothetical protein